LGGAGQVTVSWSAAATATSYNLYRGTTSAVSVATGTKFTDVTSPLTQTGLASGSTFFYIVTAVNSTGESLASAPVSASTTAAVIDGAALYDQFCSGCHGPLATSEHAGASAGAITSGIAGIGVMRTRFNATNGTLIMLTSAQISAISLALQ
jgi:mono/diheme cytochrome c family protein